MSVRARLGITFTAIMVLFLVPVWYARAGLRDLEEMAVEGRSRHAAATLALGAFRTGVVDFDRDQRAYLATRDPRMAPAVEAALRDMRAEIGHLEDAGYGPDSRELAASLDSVAALSRAIDGGIQAGRVAAANQLFQEVNRLRNRMADELGDIGATIDEASRADFARAEEMSSAASTTTILATVIAALLAVAVSLWTTGALTVPLRRLSAAASRVEGGRFEAPEDLPYDRSDEIGNLSRSFGAMTRRLGELDRLKAEFMSVASHELKTPISVVRAYAEVLETQLGEELTERQQASLAAIIEQTEVMVRLVNRLLHIGRLEAGTFRMEVEEVSVHGLVDELVRSFDVLAREGEIHLRSEIDETVPTTVPMDRDLIRNEVLGNLVSNALRFTPAGGEIRVSVWPEDGMVVFEVADTGPGVPEEKRPYIFEKYYEGGRTRFMGAGLGLAVAKEVTEAHDGRITLEPPDDGGATFRVFLPMGSPEATT